MTYPSMTQHWIVQPDDPSMIPVYRSPARPPLGGQPKAPQGPRLRAQEPLGLHGTQALVPRVDRLLAACLLNFDGEGLQSDLSHEMLHSLSMS